MPNLASTLKAEITRLSRKELRDETQGLKKAVIQYRSDIAALKRRTLALEKLVAKLGKGQAAKPEPAADDTGRHRFSAEGLAAHRKRLNLSAADFGRLVGASGQSVYKWESGKVRPQAKQLAAIAKIRTMGKREVAARLEPGTGTA